MIKKILLIVLLFMSNSGSWGASRLKGMTTTFVLPINHLLPDAKKRISLSIKIPENYKALQDQASSPFFQEFIPYKDDANNWTQIFTINCHVGKMISAKVLAEMWEATMKQQAPDFKILVSKEKDFIDYQQVEKGGVYTLGNRMEIVYMVAFSGPQDFCSVQLTKLFHPYEMANSSIIEVRKELFEKIDIINGEKE